MFYPESTEDIIGCKGPILFAIWDRKPTLFYMQQRPFLEHNPLRLFHQAVVCNAGTSPSFHPKASLSAATG